MENFFLTLYFYNELAAGPVVGSVISSVTNHVFAFWKVRARLRAPKCQPTWDRVREPLRKVTLRTGVWGTSSLYPRSVWFSVGYLSAWEKLAGGRGGICDSPGDGTISRIFHQGWVPVYSSGQFLRLCHLLTGVGTTDLGGIYVCQGQKLSADSWVPCLPWREPKTIPHHWVGKRCSSRCSMKLVRPDSKRSDCFVKPVPRVPPFAASENTFCSGHNARLALCSRTTGSDQHLPTHTGSPPFHRPSSMQIRLRSPSKW